MNEIIGQSIENDQDDLGVDSWGKMVEEVDGDRKLSKEYRSYAQTLLDKLDKMIQEEQLELPADWRAKLSAISDLPPETSGFDIRSAYREVQNAWEESSMISTVLRDPEHRGIGEMKVIDARNNFSAEEIFGNLRPEQRAGYDIDYIRSRLETEAIEHRAEFTRFLNVFGGRLKRGRICPAPEYSPFALMNTEQKDGSIRIDPEFVEDIRQMREAGIEDINLVASFATRNENGDTDMSLPDPERYCEMIESLIESVGEKGLTISIGNETNETMTSNPGDLDDLTDLAISKEIPPEEYGVFYRQIAIRLKSKYPDVKLCPAGTTFLAPNYTERVLQSIYPDGNIESKLVDRIDFHPYRSEVDEPAVAGTEVKYGDVSGRENWSYDDYENKLLDISKRYGAELIIGEVQFGGGDSPGATFSAHKKLEQTLRSSAAKGISCNVWPRVGLPF